MELVEAFVESKHSEFMKAIAVGFTEAIKSKQVSERRERENSYKMQVFHRRRQGIRATKKMQMFVLKRKKKSKKKKKKK